MYTRNEKVVPIFIEEEMKDSYINYAMSVIVGRALPDVRDGLKPVHRRILYAMKELNLEHNKPYMKCARITGNTLGRFHPHGDMAVYDTLVRMAQDFSMRYPLVDGQGNFGCFTKDTQVRLTDGRSLSFGGLIKESKNKKKNFTFTFNRENEKVEIAEIKAPRLTRKKAQIIKVTLDNNEEIKCTPDHRFMLRNGTYKQAKDLKFDDSLMPFYTKFHDGKKDANLKEYEMVYQPIVDKWSFTHHLADGWNLAKGIYGKNAGRIRHHVDFNKLNNNPDNVRRIRWEDHWILHKEIASQRHKNDLEYVKKLADGRKKFWNNPENRQRLSKHRSELNKKEWLKPEYRERMSEIIKKAWQDPTYRQRITKNSSRNLKALWQREDFRALLSQLKSKELKNRWKDEKYRFFIANITGNTSRMIWSNPKHRARMSKLSRERWQNPAYRKKQSDRAKKQWDNAEFRSKYPSDHFSKMAKKLWENPKMQKPHRDKAVKQWQDSEFRQKVIQCLKTSNMRRLAKKPNYMNELTRKAKASLKKCWKDPLYKEKVVKSKILGFVNKLLKTQKAVTPEAYEGNRTNNGVPDIQNALKYFGDFQEIIAQAKTKKNHKVKKIEFLAKKENVYDLTIENTHNFALASGIFVHNSIDGDAPAAMRYTEARLERITDALLGDIEKNTVKFVPNFDNSLTEPSVLPATLPNLILNGSSGIAVGMATNIPPHNLGEVIEGITYLIDNPECEVKDLMKKIKAPDFPTGGIICGKGGIKAAYETGRGRLLVHAKAAVESQKNGKENIIITEIPYQVNKNNLIASIANLVQDKKVEGISDLRDESDKDGMRIVIEMKRAANAQVILNQLYKHTQMQTTFGVIMLALVDNRPKILNLKEILFHYVNHRKDIVIKRTRYEKEKAEARAHILEGLKIALKNLDRVISIIKKSKDPQTAKAELMKKFKLSDKQAQAILEMQLQRLTNLERAKIDGEYKELIKKIEFLNSILASEKKILEIIKEELADLNKKFGDERRTQVMAEVEELEMEDLIQEEDVVITISHSGYIKRLPIGAYKKQKRGGKGVTGAEMKGEDFIEHLFVASTHDNLLFFSDKGKAFALKVYDVPQASRAAKGKAIINMLSISGGEKITSCIPVKEFEEGKFLMMVTRMGKVKKTKLSAFANIRKTGIIAISLAKDDSLVVAKPTTGKDEVFIATKEGKAIRFDEKGIRDMGRSAAGVRGMNLGKKDTVIGMEVVTDKKAMLLSVTEGGFGKKTEAQEYRIQSRGGKGVINLKVTSKNGQVIGLKLVSDKDEVMMITSKGMVVRCAVKDIRTTGRSAQGVHIIKLDKADKVASVARVIKEED